MTQITRLGLSGFTRPPYGSFAGKAESEEPASPRYISQVTRMGLSGFSRPPYGSFAGKEEATAIEFTVDATEDFEDTISVTMDVHLADITDLDIVTRPVDFVLHGEQEKYRRIRHTVEGQSTYLGAEPSVPRSSVRNIGGKRSTFTSTTKSLGLKRG